MYFIAIQNLNPFDNANLWLYYCYGLTEMHAYKQNYIYIIIYIFWVFGYKCFDDTNYCKSTLVYLHRSRQEVWMIHLY